MSSAMCVTKSWTRSFDARAAKMPHIAALSVNRKIGAIIRRNARNWRKSFLLVLVAEKRNQKVQSTRLLVKQRRRNKKESFIFIRDFNKKSTVLTTNFIKFSSNEWRFKVD
jgi:hypothetical protein